MQLTDTHCHIHSADYELKGGDPTHVRWLRAGRPGADGMIEDAARHQVTRLICVGTDLEDSRRAVEFVQNRANCWAAIGVHPHEAAKFVGDHKAQAEFAALASSPKVVAIGECGLDYYYEHSPKMDQKKALSLQLDLAKIHKLPVIFHIREAFDDFWTIFESYPGTCGVVHSFTADTNELTRVLEHGLYVGLNGIMTFTKDQEQLKAAKALPLQKILLETDAPFLTPQPFRGTICQPKHLRVTAEFLSELRGEPLESLAAAAAMNAQELFKL